MFRLELRGVDRGRFCPGRTEEGRRPGARIQELKAGFRNQDLGTRGGGERSKGDSSCPCSSRPECYSK